MNGRVAAYFNGVRDIPYAHPQRIGGTSMRKREPSAERGAWALARFLRHSQLAGEKGKNALADICRGHSLLRFADSDVAESGGVPGREADSSRRRMLDFVSEDEVPVAQQSD